jgi:hypothetical protein
MTPHEAYHFDQRVKALEVQMDKLREALQFLATTAQHASENFAKHQNLTLDAFANVHRILDALARDLPLSFGRS